VRGRGQEALVLRLALDAGTVVGYRALAEDVWPSDGPDDPRAALQSLVSRVRKALPGAIEAAPGGYRLALSRDEVDLTAFADLVARARADADVAAARAALALWTGDPWLPDGFDWALRDLLEDRAHAERLVRGNADADASADDHRTGPSVPSGPDARGDGPAHSTVSGTLGAGAPAPAPAPARAATVPAAIASLVGRGAELGAIAAQLADSRVVTVIGPGGAGKTTLALETARRLSGTVVELAPTTDDEVWSSIAGAVGRTVRLNESMLRLDARSRVVEALAGREVLLVLDNCEHVSAAAARAAVELLREVPGLRIVATSREPLGIAGEAFVPLGSLPDADARELFARRVRAASGADPGDDAAVRRIVDRLDGLPLALELAAAKTRTLTLAEIETGLDDRFALLSSGPRTADPRHQTLRALIDWSWDMLSPPERVALCGIAVFPDGILARDAGAVARHLGTTPAAVDDLVDRSLLQRVDGRFRMLETVREYGVDVLRSSGDEATVRRRAAAATAELALATDPLLRGPRVREAIAWYDANEENLTSALRTAEAAGDRALGIRVLRGALWAWAMRERFGALSTGLETFATDDAPLDDEPTVVACGLRLLFDVFTATAGRAGSSAMDAGMHAAFRARAVEIGSAARAHPSELSLVLPPLLTAVVHAMDDPDARWARMQGLRLDEIDDPDAPAWTRALLAVLRTGIAQNAGEIDALGDGSADALAVFRTLGDPWGIALASQMRAEWLMLHGRLDEALTVADAAHAQLVGLTSTSDILQQRSMSIVILGRLGRFDEAHAQLADIEGMARADGSARALLQFRFTAATLAIAAGDGEAAVAHLTSPETTMTTFGPGGPRSPGGPDGPGGADDSAGAGRQNGPDGPGGPGEQFRAWVGARTAQALLLQGRASDAAAPLRAAIPQARASGDQPIISDAVLTLAWWLAVTGRPDEARRAFGQAVRVRGHADETDPVYRRVEALVGAPPAPVVDDDSEVDAVAALLG